AARGGLRATCAARGVSPEARPAAGERLPLPLLRLDRDTPREHLRPDALPLAPLLRELPPAVRAVQDDLTRNRQDGQALPFPRARGDTDDTPDRSRGPVPLPVRRRRRPLTRRLPDRLRADANRPR